MTKLVRDLMHPGLITCRPDTSLGQAAELMIHKHHHRLVVIDHEDPDAFPLGIISSFDIVAAMARPGSVWQS